MRRENGFTLTEIMIVLPIVALLGIIMTEVFLGSMFNILSNNRRGELKLEAQTMLFTMQDELLFATNFGSTNSSDLNDATEPSGGWTHNTDPQTLIIYETSLNAPRRDPDRDFVYRNNYGCSSSYNSIAIDNVIYHSIPNPESDTERILLKRRLTPQYSTCNGPNYQSQTCWPASEVGSNGCEGPDVLLSEHLRDFNVVYFDEDNNVVTGQNAPQYAERVTVEVILGENRYGRDIVASAELTMRKIN